MRLSRMTPADLPAVLALAQELGDVRHLNSDELAHRTFSDPASPEDLRLLAWAGGDLVGFCLASIVEARGIIKLFGVGEAHRRRGVGTALFDELEGRLRGRGIAEVAAEGVGPNYFLPGVELSHTDAISFLMHRGYETDRRARVDLEVDLEQADLDTREVEVRLRAEGILLRRARPSEVGSAAAFALEISGSVWQREVERSTVFDPPSLYVALEGQRLVGFATYDVDGPARFGPIGTLASHRRRGIGGALLKMCLRGIRENGYARSEIGWAGPIGFYARAVRARIHRVYWVFRKSLAN